MEPPQPGHDHAQDALQLTGGSEQSAMYAVASLGLISNLCLIGFILAQRHTRRLRLAFLLHSAFLNLLQSGLAFAFGNGLRPEGISSDSCRDLTTSYIIFQTVWVFNLIPAACCEIYYLDSGAGRPRSSGFCVGFGVALVYTCSAILHLGPTLIGANFDWSANSARCLFLHGHPKNYTVYLMWMVIVTVALGVTAYYLAKFRSSIDESMRCRLRNAAFRSLQKSRHRSSVSGRSVGAAAAAAAAAAMAEAMLTNDAALASRLADLAALKTNRHRVLCGVCGVCALCWYPLYLLVLLDPHYKAPVAVYHLFTVLGFSKTLFEPLCFLAFDKAVGRPCVQLWPCTSRTRYVGEDEIDDRLAAAASSGCPERSDSTSVIASASIAGRQGGEASVPPVAAASPMPPSILHHHHHDHHHCPPSSLILSTPNHNNSAPPLVPRFLLTTDPDDFDRQAGGYGGNHRLRFSPPLADQFEQRRRRSPTPPEVFSPSSPFGYR